MLTPSLAALCLGDFVVQKAFSLSVTFFSLAVIHDQRPPRERE